MIQKKFVLVWIAVLFSALFLDETESSTLIATKCVDGIVLAADSLSAKGGGSILISSRTSKKVFMLTESTAIGAVFSSGSESVHFQRLYNELRETIRSHETSFESTLTVSAIVNVARQLVSHKYNEAHVVIAGWEGDKNLSKMAQVEGCNYVLSEILPGGTRIDQATVVAGSGSSLISNLLEESLGQGENVGIANDGSSGLPVLAELTVAEALPKLRRCLSLAAKLDPQTGGDKFSLWVLARHNEKEAETESRNADSISQSL